MTLGEREIHVWIWRHDTPPPDVNVLTTAERERAERFRSPVIQKQFRGTRASLRHVLARYVDRVEIIGDGGKPRLASGEVDFNVTHTAGISLIAVARKGMSIGIDVERVRPLLRVESLARRFFSADEVRDILAAENPDRAFIGIWTRKEALVKALGIEMWTMLHQRGEIVDVHEWTTIDVDPHEDGYVAAAAFRAGPHVVHYFDI